MGDVFGLYYSELKRIAHCGFVDQWDGIWCITVEANTNSVGAVISENDIGNPIRAGPDEGELTEIIPAGTFVYQPDSGYAGAATRVRIYRQHQQRSIDQDTSTVRLTAITNRVGVDSTVHQQEKRQVEGTKKSKPLGIWVYLVVALGVLGVVLYLFVTIKNHS
ncbi:hypothetical protein SAMN05216436_1178 [bacterium A37T11]|nr:hypothetical protein SAMN05216436_1178 [bacterium A37T11]